MVEADDVHVGEDKYSKTIFHKAGDDFDFFGLTHGFYLDALFGEDLLLEAAEAARPGKHDLRILGCFF